MPLYFFVLIIVFTIYLSLFLALLNRLADTVRLGYFSTNRVYNVIYLECYVLFLASIKLPKIFIPLNILNNKKLLKYYLFQTE